MERDGIDELTVVGDRTIALPRCVTAAEWALERNQFQNARIRTLLGAIGLLERVMDSNVAILHCSPARAREVKASTPMRFLKATVQMSRAA